MLSKIWQRAALDVTRDQSEVGWGVRRGRARGRKQNLPSSALLNLGEVQLEQVVDPCHELLSAKAR